LLFIFIILKFRTSVRGRHDLSGSSAPKLKAFYVAKGVSNVSPKRTKILIRHKDNED
jgi:hypothetical protein